MDEELKYEIIDLLSKYMSDLHYKNELMKHDYETNYQYKTLDNNSTIDNIKNVLNKICKHNWTTDYIDDKYGTSKKIIYCTECEITK